MSEKLRIGKLSYANIYPVFHLLDQDESNLPCEFVELYPSALNRMLREGELDISPSSSIEYLRNEDLYDYIAGHSISALGPIGSVLLFSRVPIESLEGQEVFATHQSATSIALLRIILCRFYQMDCNVRVTEAPFEEAIASHSAYLSIGDEALVAAHKTHRIDVESSEPDATLCTIDHQLFYVYDLSTLWYRNTGLPFVFALWIVRKDSMQRKGDLIRHFTEELDRARDRLPGRLGEISRSTGLPIDPGELENYWKGIIYGLDEHCLKGLERFRQYLVELKLL